MKVLLDTCALIWWWAKTDSLSKRALTILRDPENRFFVSPASAWEISTKYRIGKFPSGEKIIRTWNERLSEDGLDDLPILSRHALKAGTLPSDHRDPFDRMIAAQSLIESIPVLTSDRAIGELGAKIIW